MKGTSANLLYFLGAGRSGTSILAAMLSSADGISWFGELTHLAHWQDASCQCSCGQSLKKCAIWHSRGLEEVLGPAMQAASRLESHRNILPSLAGLHRFSDDYCRQQSEAIRAIGGDQEWVVDSSKYTGRALGLAGCERVNAKFIYLVRDPRGVAHSFGKNVQTRRKTLSACLYYLTINFLAQISVWTRLKGRCMKVRYEDLATNPERVLTSIAEFLNVESSALNRMTTSGTKFAAEHIAGGNRWAADGPVEFDADLEWRKDMSKGRQLLIYLMCFPFQIINRYGF